ncbi:MAG: ARMT1-like domain-containing protein [Pseudomonadota bacterium]
METCYDCLPCFVRQTLDAVRLVTSDQGIHESVVRTVLGALSKIDFRQSPPVMGRYIHRLIREESGCDDPYKSLKDQYNRYALRMIPTLRKTIADAVDRMETAVRLSIAGNIIDFGASLLVDSTVIDRTIASSLTDRLTGNIHSLYEGISSASRILYIGDNTGEIVFDRLLIEQLPLEKITFAVRGMPILNDATMDDAMQTGMTDLVRVIHNGADAPGTILGECSPEFIHEFDQADLVIAKGQGNFETLSEVDRNIVFLLKAKCPVIAGHIGCRVGDSVVGRMNDFKQLHMENSHRGD